MTADGALHLRTIILDRFSTHQILWAFHMRAHSSSPTLLTPAASCRCGVPTQECRRTRTARTPESASQPPSAKDPAFRRILRAESVSSLSACGHGRDNLGSKPSAVWGSHGLSSLSERLYCAWIITCATTGLGAPREAEADGRPPRQRRVPGPGPASPRTAAQVLPRRRARRRWARAKRPAQAGPGRGYRTSVTMLAAEWLA
jgi:hypothetical protein